MWIAPAAAAALMVSESTSGMTPPPVTVQPLLLVPSGDARTASNLKAAVRRLVERRYIVANLKQLKSVSITGECIENLACVRPRDHLRRHGGQVAVIAYGPKRQTRWHEVRCVGPDPLRHYTLRIDLISALSQSQAVADAQLTKLATCMISSIQKPKRAE